MADVWTDERIAELRRLVAEGTSFARIAVRLGVTRSAAIGKASRLKIVTPKTPREPATQFRKRNLERLSASFLRRVRDGIARAASPCAGTWLSDRSARLRERIPRPVAQDPLNLSIDALEPHHCRYITNDSVREATYCGRRAVAGTSWCAFHLNRVRVLVMEVPLAPETNSSTSFPPPVVEDAQAMRGR